MAKLILHVGAHKTGTTYLQDRLARNTRSLSSHGVTLPTRSPVVSPGLFHFRAALDLLGQDWGGEQGHAEGSWDALVRRVRRARAPCARIGSICSSVVRTVGRSGMNSVITSGMLRPAGPCRSSCDPI